MTPKKGQKQYSTKVKKTAVDEALRIDWVVRRDKRFLGSRRLLAGWILERFRVHVPTKPPKMSKKAKQKADEQIGMNIRRKASRFPQAQEFWAMTQIIRSVLIVACGTNNIAAYEIGHRLVICIEDLRYFLAFCQKPADFTSEEAGQILTKFIAHVSENTVAAKKLLLEGPELLVRDIL